MKTCIDCTDARTCKFKDYQSKQKLPVVIYFDCEALNRKVNVHNGKTKVIADQDIIPVGMYCNVLSYYKPYFSDYIDKYETFITEIVVIDFIKALKVIITN